MHFDALRGPETNSPWMLRDNCTLSGFRWRRVYFRLWKLYCVWVGPWRQGSALKIERKTNISDWLEYNIHRITYSFILQTFLSTSHMLGSSPEWCDRPSPSPVRSRGWFSSQPTCPQRQKLRVPGVQGRTWGWWLGRPFQERCHSSWAWEIWTRKMRSRAMQDKGWAHQSHKW